MKHIAFALLAASLYAQTPQPLRDPYQDYRHLGEFDLRSAKTVRPKVVLLTPADDSVCLTPYEEVYSWTGGTKHICQPTTYSAATGTWQTISGAGATEPAASSLAAIDDFRTVRTSSTVLTINPDAATNRVVGGVGDTPYAFTAPATVTVSGSGASGTVYIAQRDDGVLTHTHNSIACTFAESGITEVTGTTYTGKAIATATVTNCLWDASGVTDMRGFFSQAKKITVGAGLLKTEDADSIELSASSTGGFNPTDLSKITKQTIFYEAMTNLHQGWNGWNTLTAFDHATPTATNGSLVGWTGAGGFAYWPGADTANSSLPLFLNGTPKVFKAAMEAGKGTIVGGDIYYGFSGAIANIDNFVGVRWNNSATAWQCVVRSGGLDSGTPVTITGSTNDSNPHKFVIRGDGTANTFMCSYDGGAEVSPTSPTFPTFTRLVYIMGMPSGVTVMRLGRVGISIEGQ
jgi:hypothetical protein